MTKENERRSPDRQAKAHEILENLSTTERELLNAVIKEERGKLHMQRPRGINEELWRALTEIIK